MSSVNYENQILDAIETMVDNAVSKAGYDRTIQGTIISLEDAETGKYKIKYQDSEIEAYSSNIDIKYPEGTLVYITIPNNDFSKTKTILDTVDKEAIERNIIKEEDEQYEIEVGNSIAAIQEFELCSYKDNNKLYLYDVENNVNSINFDPIVFSESIAETRMILCGAKFKTDLPVEQQKSGNFGFGVTMEFTDNITGDVIQKDFVVDVNRMTGSPYDQKDYTKQYDIFEISNENFIQVKSIYIFEKGFPYIITNDNLLKNDIFIKDFELYGLRDLSNSNGYTLVLSKPGKGYFNEFSLPTDAVTIESVLRNDGKIVNNTEIQYYWFRENNDVKINDINYINYAGEGWECINEYNIVDEQTKMWLTQNDKCVITRSFCNSSCTNIKCIVVKREEILAEDEICIYVYEGNTELSIISNLGTKFYFDNGRPTLTCYVDQEDNIEDYTYSWSMVDVNGTVTELSETVDQNIEYNNAVADYNSLQAQIEAEEIMPTAVQSQLEALQLMIENYKDIQRVEKNKVINIDMRQITSNTTFKCLVKSNTMQAPIIGTTTITLYNVIATEGEYTLNIINGDQVFTYNDLGVAPTSQSLERPITINPLSFEIKDNLGFSLSQTVLNECEVQWIVPTENTLLIAENSDVLTLNYTIADEYDINKTNNNIKLIVKYKNLILETKTNFTFMKQGEPGTNGTDIICKIVPNTTDNNFDDYPMIANGELNYPRPSGQTNKWFKIQLWNSGEKIWENVGSDGTCTVEWKVLGNTYTDSIADDSAIKVNGSDFSYLGYKYDSVVNIVRGSVNYNGINYYCTMPIITAKINSNNYKIKLLKDTGFRYVCYSSDGRNPQYANAKPFTLQVLRKINGYFEDVSLVSNDYKVNYTWVIKGRYYNGSQWVTDEHLSVLDTEVKNNEKFYIPSENYDGENVTNALEIRITDKNNSEIGKIYIPIHFYLNRYGLGLFSDWDGNSITLDHEKGRILAPQAGAGELDANGQFTGVYIGSVREAGRQTKDVGLIAYSKGQRSIFLNSKNGSAIFGKNNNGQIIIDPQSNKALLYSNSFWKNYNLEGNNYGLPSNYNTSNESGAGMIIDLAKPEIRYGSGKFKVNENGELTAQGGGKIAGWTIGKDGSDDVLYNNQLFLNGTKGQIYSIKKGLETNSDGFYLAKEGIALGKTTTYETTDGTNVTKSKFQVDNAGNLYAGNAILKGRVTATSGYIGNGSSGWTIASTAIYNGKPNRNNKNNLTETGVYIGTSGIGLGQTIDYGSGSYHSIFEVTNAGKLYANQATVKGNITADSGKIGPWNITDTSIWYGNKNYGNTNGLYWGTSGLSLSNKFKVDSAGALTATNVTITADGKTSGNVLNINSKFTVDYQGNMTAKAGYIGNGSNGWTIGNTSIYNGTNSISSTTAGTYLGVDGIRNYKDSTHYTTITNGKITSLDADIKGKVTATSGTFGDGTNKITIGTNGNESNIHSGSKTTFNSTNSGFYIGTDGIAFGAYSSGHSPFEVTTSGAVTTSNITVTGGSFSIGSNFSVTTAGLMTAKSGYIGNGSNGWTIGNTALYNTKTGIGDNNESGVYIGTTGIGLGSRNNYGTSSSTDYHAKFEVTSAGALYASNANIDGKITADEGKIGGWSITSGKIYAGDSNTGVAVMQCPSSNITWVFAAGGDSHSSYGDCPFRVDKNGNMYATKGRIGSWNISSGAIVNNNHSTVKLNSDGSVHFGTSSYYFEMGVSTNHPKVSGLNCQGGLSTYGLATFYDTINIRGGLNLLKLNDWNIYLYPNDSTSGGRYKARNMLTSHTFVDSNGEAVTMKFYNGFFVE